ncbi:MAG: helix-turn-helix transcriptional regulator [Candidatus Paceibacterota bacterium]|jgi:transcriptional regulator with XRE-family HTH domain|nr:helix-turn-helix transcriptional regulator [Anaerolineaceae bacterium]
MKERIKKIMEIEQLTSTRFADRLQINRAVISHILNGRNNPSLEVVTRILAEMDYINPEWLLNGTGSLYKEGVDPDTIEKEPDLFHQNVPEPDKIRVKPENEKEMGIKEHSRPMKGVEKEIIAIPDMHDRKITQIIIYYNDNTFEIFQPPHR